MIIKRNLELKDEEESWTQIINEMKNLQRAQITPKKMIESKGTQKHNERQNNTQKKWEILCNARQLV